MENLGSILAGRRHSDAIAVIDISSQGHSREWCYQEIEERSRAIAGELQEWSFPLGSRIGILSGNSVPYLLTHLGIMRAGHVCVPINARQPADVIDFICRDADIKLVLTDADNRRRVSGIPRLMLMDFVGSARHSTESTAVNNECAAQILYTSGSTGRPKGVVLSHQSQLAIVTAVCDSPDRAAFHGQRGIVAAPMFHMNAIISILMFLVVGGSVVLLSKFRTETFAEAIVNYDVKTVTGVPTMLAMLYANWVKVRSMPFDGVSTVFIGSAPLSSSVVTHIREMMPNARILNSYGTTETGGGIFGPHPDGHERPSISVGYPQSHVEVRLEGNGRQGALYVRTPSSMSEYLNLPELTAQRFKGGWFETGDLFRIDKHGFYYFVGRSDDMFVCSGENVYPSEVEKAIESHKSVIQSVVVPVSDPIRGQVPVAFVVDRNPQVSEKEIQEHVRANAASHLFPRRVWFLRQLPLGSTNKIDRRALTQEAEKRVREEST